MLLTEEQAGQTLCHKAMGHPNGGWTCRASGCMGWRWGEVECGPVIERRAMLPGEHRPEGFDGAQTDAGKSYWVKCAPVTPRGFCGLAGPVTR